MEKEVSFYVLFALTYFFLLSMIGEFERPNIYIIIIIDMYIDL